MGFSEFLGEIGQVWESFAEGYRAGHEVNEHVVQPYLDEHQAGSGDLGHSYLEFINSHGDPAHAVEATQHFLDTVILHHDDHQVSHTSSPDIDVPVDHNHDYQYDPNS